MSTVAIKPESSVEAIVIAGDMFRAGLPAAFIVAAVATAFEIEGVRDLMQLWAQETDPKERDAIVSDIQDLIDDFAQKEKVEEAYVRFDDLDAIVKDIRAFKDHLRATVDEQGGLKRLSESTGIPQPSLSRFFNSASRPRRSTLYKIAKALKLDHFQVATAWSK